MPSPTARPELIRETNLEEYFHGAVTTAAGTQEVEIARETVRYVAGMLAHFTRADRLFDRTPDGVMIRPLAALYAEAVQSVSPRARLRALRRLGDVALFIAGAFSRSLERKPVDVDYYVAMGGSAYACLSEGAHAVPLPFPPLVFDELSRKFVDLVDVVAEARDSGRADDDSTLLRDYELWLRTGSRRAARRLRRAGIVPARSNVSRASH